MSTTTPTASPTEQHQEIEASLNAALFYLRATHTPHAFLFASLSARRAWRLLDSAYADSEAKRFATLQAQFALLGHTLHQSGPGDDPGPVSYMAERWGMARYLPTLEDVEQFLAEIEGAGNE